MSFYPKITFLFFSFILLTSLAITPAHALVPQEKDLNQFFQVMTGWNRSSMEIYREGDSLAEGKGKTITVISEEATWQEGDDTQCQGVYNECGDNGCHQIKKEGRRIVDKDNAKTKQDAIERGTCVYENKISIQGDYIGTDFSSSVASDQNVTKPTTDQVLVPKLQSGKLAYEYKPTDPTQVAGWGYLNLTLPIEDQLKYKIETAKKARVTKNLCARTKNCAMSVGWVNPDLEVIGTDVNGGIKKATLGDIFDKLPGSVSNLEPGYSSVVLTAYQQGDVWATLLMGSPMLAEAGEGGYALANATKNGLLGEIVLALAGGGKKESFYPDAGARSIFDASLIELNTFAPPEFVTTTLEQAHKAVSTRLFGCLQDATEACTPGALLPDAKYEPLTLPRVNEILNSRIEKQAQASKDGDSFSVDGTSYTQDTAGAVESSPLLNIINTILDAIFVPTKMAESTFQRTHYIPPLHIQAAKITQAATQALFFDANSQSTHNSDGSINTVKSQDDTKHPAGGKPISQHARIGLAVLSCDDTNNYSIPTNDGDRRTDIEALAINKTKISCVDTSTADISCKPEYTESEVNKAAKNAEKLTGIPADWLMAILTIESADAIKDGKFSITSCEENDATAAGPLAITSGTYKDVTCSNEQMKDIGICESPDPKLSRCNLQDSFILSARVLRLKLFAVGDGNFDKCNVGKPTQTFTSQQLYTAANNYYGRCTPDSLTSGWNIPGLNRAPNYGDIACYFTKNCTYPASQCP